MTIVAEFLIDVLRRTISSLCATYLVRLFDKIKHKNNRYESK